tara:strand:+ start:644 stop:766 length:123 start_codon:yes stop_codon:yes gene_type:complete
MAIYMLIEIVFVISLMGAIWASFEIAWDALVDDGGDDDAP